MKKNMNGVQKFVATALWFRSCDQMKVLIASGFFSKKELREGLKRAIEIRLKNGHKEIIMTEKKQTGIYPLVGLNKERSATLLGPKQDFFWAKIIMPQDRISALWDFCKNNWDEPKFARIIYDDLSSDGFPVNAKMTELILDPKKAIL